MKGPPAPNFVQMSRSQNFLIVEAVLALPMAVASVGRANTVPKAVNQHVKLYCPHPALHVCVCALLCAVCMQMRV